MSLQPVADYIADKMQTATTVDIIMATSITAAVILLTLILWYIVESTKEEIIVESPSYEEEDFSKFQKLLDERKERESKSGTTSRYSWKQCDQEIDLFIPIQEYKSGSITKSDIKVDIRASFIAVTIAGETVLNDIFFAAVVPDECNWQIESRGDSDRRLWINIFKRVATTKQNHWKYILIADQNAMASQADDLPLYELNEGISCRVTCGHTQASKSD
jgi:CS domain